MTVERLKSCKNATVSCYVIPIILLLLGFFVFWTYNIVIISDMGSYLCQALNIYLGEGYTQMDGEFVSRRTPFFPLMIMSAYRSMGVSLWAAFWVVRIFAIVNPVVVYFLGKRFYNKWVGLIAAMFMLTSFNINHWSYRQLDAVWPCFVLVSIWLSVIGYEKGGTGWLMLAGLFMGLSFLVKEVTILLFPIPVLAFLLIGEYRSTANLRKVVFYGLVLGATILPWLFYQYTKSGFSNFLGAGTQIVGIIMRPRFYSGEKTFSVMSEIVYRLKPFWFFYNESLSSHVVLTPLFVIAWIFTFFKAFKKNKYSIIICLCLFFYMPVIYFVGKYASRLGQVIIILMLSYLIVANFLWELSKFISARLTHHAVRWCKPLGRAIILLLTSAVICFQVFFTHGDIKGSSEFFKRSVLYQRFFKGNDQFAIGHSYGQVYKEAGEWIKNNLPVGSRIMMSKRSEAKPLYFFSMGKHPIFEMSVMYSNQPDTFSLRKTDDRVIFISSWSTKNVACNKICSLTEEKLLEGINDKQIDYIVVSKRRNYLSLYLDANSSFEKIKEFGDGEVKVYKVKQLHKVASFKPLVSNYVIAYLNTLRKKDIDKLNWYKEKYFNQLLGWDKNQIDQLLLLKNRKESEMFELVDNGRIY